jgi:hypothetical protein
MELHSHRFAANPQTLIHRSWQSSPVAPDVPVPVLLYQSVSDAPAGSTRALSVRHAMFAAHLCYLRHQGFNGLTFGELCQRRRIRQPLPARPIVLTFDDGYADLIEDALPIMIEQGHQGPAARPVPAPDAQRWRAQRHVWTLARALAARAHGVVRRTRLALRTLTNDLSSSATRMEGFR